jgi:hypothetical protein
MSSFSWIGPTSHSGNRIGGLMFGRAKDLLDRVSDGA